MYIDFKKIFFVLSILTVGVIIGIAGGKLVERYQSPKQTVSVVGAGEVDATTDQVNITIQIKTISATFEKAQSKNKTDVNNLKNELIKLKIPESRITVSSYSEPIFGTAEQSTDYLMPIRKPTASAPVVITDLNLIIDPIKDVDKIFDLVSKNPSAQITNTYYSLKNRKAWESKAKEDALKDARSQVESIAKINRLKVGKLLTIEDANNPKPYPVALKAMDNTNESAPQKEDSNIYYSEQSVKITSSYTATYELY